MFKVTDRQGDLFGVTSELPESARQRLEASWAEQFRQKVLPLLLASEADFAGLYGKTGRPNHSVARDLGISLLQEMHGLHDQAALDAYAFDRRWQHALDVTCDQAYLSRRSLVEFRRRLVQQDPGMDLVRAVFERVGKAAIADLGLATGQQRLDSTLIVSNIKVCGLLELFRKTTRHFLKGLDDERMAQVSPAIQEWFEHSGKGWFGLGAAAYRDWLSALLPHVKELIDLYSNDEEVRTSERYLLLVRAFDEHCQVCSPGANMSSGGNPSGSQEPHPVDEALSGSAKKSDKRSKKPRKKKSDKRSKKKRKKRKPVATTRDGEEIVLEHKRGATLQSPHDPDAAHGHKGAGYHVHITETCNNAERPEIITDYEVHAASRSDAGKAVDVLERLERSQQKPHTIYADAGYPTPDQLVNLRAQGVELYAPVHRGKLKDEVLGRDVFLFDEEGHVLACPCGHSPIDHRMQNPNGEGVSFYAYFGGDLCRQCFQLDRCPVRAPNHRAKGGDVRATRGNFRLDLSPSLRARDERFAEQKQKQWKDRYKIRSGIEATMSELKRAHGMGNLRVRRKPRVHLAVAYKATACNVKRWLRAVLAALLACIYALLRAHTPHQRSIAPTSAA